MSYDFRATRERDEYREIQEEAEKTYRLLEKDFREVLAAKDEELKRSKAEYRLTQKELEAQLKNSSTTMSISHIGNHEYLDSEKMRRLKNELSVLKEQNRKLLNELQVGQNSDK